MGEIRFVITMSFLNFQDSLFSAVKFPLFIRKFIHSSESFMLNIYFE